MYIESENLLKTIKELDYKQLDLLAIELREKLIASVSKTGGHLASNLGAVELTLALHKSFDSPKDKIVFDVGHQCYIHKMITGRLNEMDSLRQFGGISGFPKISESEHDMYDSGHSSTSVSAALGYAVARDINEENYHCVAVIGDGALTGGVAYEALNFAGSRKTPLIVVLNDNEMSISPNVGGMAKYLNNLRISKQYLDLKQNLKDALKDNPKTYEKLKNARNKVKDILLPTNIFEDLGFKYLGPIDGHSIEDMCRCFEAAKQMNRPVLIHAITKKGKGFISAEQNPAKFHGIGPFNPAETSSSQMTSDQLSYSEFFGQCINRLASEDERIVAVSAAMTDATGLGIMKKNYPSRCFDVGIAEQNAVSFAAGMALNGLKPVAAIYSTFLQRAYDQILSEVCLMNLPVVFAIDRAGVTGSDGETHQGNFDLAYLSSMPNMTVLAPKDAGELSAMLKYALSLNSPAAIRYPRANAIDPDKIYTPDEICRPEELISGSDFAVISVGSMAGECLAAVNLLKQDGINAALYNLRSVKPLNTEFLLNGFGFKRIAVVEDGTFIGGAGSAIAEYYAEVKNSPNVLCIGWPDKFIEHGSIKELRHKYGMDAEGISKKLKEFFAQ